MALTPIDQIHALQIQAGTLGRHNGHEFESYITSCINSFRYPLETSPNRPHHVSVGDPATLLLNYICHDLGVSRLINATAISTGALATSQEGKRWLTVNNIEINRCKSDLVITITKPDLSRVTLGISTKQCSNPKPTNAQLYFTTARGFSKLLINNGINVSNTAIDSLRQFCGDEGFRPMDDVSQSNRLADPRRYFWEEINAQGRTEWEILFSNRQDEISRLLFQKAYLNDPFSPDYLLHKTKFSADPTNVELAIYSIDELVTLSRNYQGYCTKPYSVRKGSYKDQVGVVHLAPRFGIIQMQRGGQTQHPEQLQFNLEAGYFYKLG